MHLHSFNKKIFDFVIFSNLFIAACALAMVSYTWHLFFNTATPLYFSGFIFFSTLASYSIHWYLTDAETERTAFRNFWLSANKRIHIAFFIISTIGSSFFLLQEIKNFKWLLPAIVLTIMYSAPKFPHPFFKALQKIVLGKTILLAAMWMYVTCALPILIHTDKWLPVYTLFCINRFALIFPICILFDLRDKDYDKNVGIKTLITHLPVKNIKIIFVTALIICISSSFVYYNYNQGIINVIFLIIPAIITWLLYPPAVKTKNDYLFYFILDGLMALTPILYFVWIFIGSWL